MRIFEYMQLCRCEIHARKKKTKQAQLIFCGEFKGNQISQKTKNTATSKDPYHQNKKEIKS